MDFDLVPGTNFQLALSGTADVYRNNGSVSYPYSLGGLVDITTSNANSPLDFYYFFYDWEIIDSCVSDRTPVTANVDAGITYYADTDNDGFGDPSVDSVDCVQPTGYVANNFDNCDNDPNKINSGVCGCGVADTDTDTDGTPDCNDLCPLDTFKTTPGTCGCGVADVDTDTDGTPDCNDLCPLDTFKTAPGTCGCGTADIDTDGDGTLDCNDLCPLDTFKTAPGVCGCGIADIDTDSDGTLDCNDLCPLDTFKIAPGTCGCGSPEPGTPCDDGLASTINDTITPSCGCAGVPSGANTWTGTTSNDWHEPTNWSFGLVPTQCNDDVQIPNVNPNPQPTVISGSAFANNLTVMSGGSVTITSGAELEVCGDLNNAGVSGMGDGKILMNGTTNQLLQGGVEVGLLELDNANGANLFFGTLKVTEGLILTQGVMSGGASTTLGSDAGGTAYLDDFTGVGSFTGSLTVERYVANPGNAFHYISSSINNGPLSQWAGDFSFSPINGASDGSQFLPDGSCVGADPTSPYANLWEYREHMVTGCNLEGWHVRLSGTSTNGQGFAGVIPNGTTLDQTGSPNTGNVSYGPVTKSVANTSNSKGFNLLGNPYPSPLNWPALSAANGGLGGTAYLWVSTGYYGGSIQPLSALIPSQDIASGQSFEVEVLGVAPQSVTVNFDNTMRRTTDPAFQRNGVLYDHRLDLIVEGNSYADKTHIVFLDGPTLGWDGQYDGRKKLSNPGQPTLYTEASGGEELSINALPEYTGTEVIPMGIYPGTSGTYTIRAEELESFPIGTLVFLEDKQDQVMHCLSGTPSYVFTSDVSDGSDRFNVLFTPGVELGTERSDCEGLNGEVWIDFGLFSIDNSSTNFEWDYYEIRDHQGSVVKSGTGVNGMVSSSNLLPGQYEVEFGYNGAVFTETLTVGSRTAVDAEFTVSDQSVSVDELIQFSDQSTGATLYNWDFGDGTILNGVSDPVHQYSQPGTYEVWMYAENDECGDSHREEILVSRKTTGIDDLSGYGVQIYGVQDQIHIRFEPALAEGGIVTVHNAIGEEIISNVITGDEVLELRQPAGYYLVRVTIGSESVVRKLLLGTD